MSDIDAKGTPAIAEPPPVEELGKAPSSSETLSRAWSASMQSPVKFMNALMKMSPAIVASARKSIAEGGMTAGVPETRFNVPVGPHKMFDATRSEEHTSELQSLMRISNAGFCLKKKK